MRLSIRELLLFYIVFVVFVVLVVVLVALAIRALVSYLSTPTKGQAVSQTPSKTLAQALKDHRIRCNLTQSAVAQALGVSPQLVNQWETGELEPTMSNLSALAKLYGVTLAQLLQGVN